MLAEYHCRKKPFNQLSLVMIEHELLSDEDYKHAIDFCNQYGIEFHKWGFLDRAGNVQKFKNELNRSKGRRICEQKRPFERLHILADGSVIPCCQDWYAENLLGNIQDNTICEIWSSTQFASFRKQLSEAYGNAPDLCRRCKLFTPVD